MKNKILILGLGNEILRDDGIGPKLARHLQEVISVSDIDYQIVAAGGLEIIELINGYDTVIFIDAIKTRGGIPGTVYYFKPSDFKETAHLSSLHDVSFLTALELGKKLNYKIPGKIHIIAIEIVEDMEFGEEFTPSVQEKFDSIKEQIYDFVVGII